jgi:hypothetical protein
MRVARRNRERFALFEQRLSEVFESTCDHQTRVRQVEALRHGAGKVERLRHDHFARRMREVECDVVPEHSPMIIRGLLLSGADQERETRIQ